MPLRIPGERGTAGIRGCRLLPHSHVRRTARQKKKGNGSLPCGATRFFVTRLHQRERLVLALHERVHDGEPFEHARALRVVGREVDRISVLLDFRFLVFFR